MRCHELLVRLVVCNLERLQVGKAPEKATELPIFNFAVKKLIRWLFDGFGGGAPEIRWLRALLLDELK